MSSELDPFTKSSEGEEILSRNEYAAEDLELEDSLAHIWNIAKEFHLDPFPTHFEIVPPHIINQLGAYGVPGRFSHWTHGRQYRRLKTMYDYGLSKIYELVINSNPSQAFLLENNPPIENKFVMAHVLGHTDFFKNNQLFIHTRQDMPEAAARNAARIQSYEEQAGKIAVEQCLDAVLAIEEHIDPYQPLRPSAESELKAWRDRATRKQRTGLLDEFDDLLGSPEGKMVTEGLSRAAIHIPPTPDRDLLGFMKNHAPYLEDWQRDVIDIVRSESIYFYPQRRTKIMNEGWASYWHKRIMREMGSRGLIADQENEAWWLVHSGVLASNKRSLNPYHLGMTIFECIEDYYNGNLTDEEQSWLKKENIPLPLRFDGELKDSPAIQALRDIMAHNDDQSFVRNYFNKIVADRMGLYIYEERQSLGADTVYVVKDTGWQKIRDKLVASMDNCGNPLIVVIDGDYNHASELYLRHEFDGQSLDPEYIAKTLPYVFALWQRPVHLETVDSQSDKKITYAYDGMKILKAGDGT